MQLSSFRRKSSISRVILYTKIDCSPCYLSFNVRDSLECVRTVPETPKNLELSNQVILGSRDVPNYPLREHLRRTQTFDAQPSALKLLYLNGVESRGGKCRVWSLSTLTSLVLSVSKTSGSRWSPSIN